MSVFFADIIAGAKSLADFDGTGAGSSLGLDDSRWSIWGNQSIEALYKKFQIWNPDLFNTSADFTLNLNEGVITPPADYRSFRGLTKWPDTNRKREIHKFNLGARDSQCDVHYRPAGKQLLLEPKLRSTGTYRLYYASGPVNLSTGDAPSTQQITDATAKVMLGNELVLTPYLYDGNVVYTPASGHVVRMAGTLAAGPGNVGWLPNGVEGPGKTLTAQFDAAITIDGLTPSLGDRVLVFQPNGSGAGPIGAPDYGVYQFTQIYTVPGHRYIVMRVGDYDEASEVTFGSSVLVSAGSTYAGQRFVLNTPDPIVVDETLLNFIPVGSPQLSIDGVNVTVGDHIFVNTQGEHSYDGLYDLSLFSDGLTQYWWFTRSSGQSAGTNRPVGYTVAVTQGATNGNKIWQADGNLMWAITTTTWSKLQAAIDTLYEPAREWLEVRIAMRALGKGEESTSELGARLAELTQELQVYVQSLDAGDGDTAVDVEHNPNPFHHLFRW